MKRELTHARELDSRRLSHRRPMRRVMICGLSLLSLVIVSSGCAFVNETSSIEVELPPVAFNDTVPGICSEIPSGQDLIGLSGDDGVYCVRPASLTGTAVETASVSIPPGQGWIVNPIFLEGPTGIDAFNELAAECFMESDLCPAGPGGKGRLAISFDNRIVSAPSINADVFERDQIQISGNFSEAEARELAAVLGSDAANSRVAFHYVVLDPPMTGLIAGS